MAMKCTITRTKKKKLRIINLELHQFSIAATFHQRHEKSNSNRRVVPRIHDHEAVIYIYTPPTHWSFSHCRTETLLYPSCNTPCRNGPRVTSAASLSLSLSLGPMHDSRFAYTRALHFLIHPRALSGRERERERKRFQGRCRVYSV